MTLTKLRPEIEQQLLAFQSRRAARQRGTSASDVGARYGMTWQGLGGLKIECLA